MINQIDVLRKEITELREQLTDTRDVQDRMLLSRMIDEKRLIMLNLQASKKREEKCK